MALRIKYQLDQITLDGFCHQGGYKSTIPNPAIPGGTLPNPETHLMYIERRIYEYFTEEARAGNKKLLRDAPRTVQDQADRAAINPTRGELS